MAYEKKEQLYEGKAKKVYATNDPEVVIVSYKDDATAFNGLKKGTIAGKGAEGDTRGAFSKYADLTERAIHVQKTIIRKLAARESCSSSRRLSTARWTIWTARCSRLPAPAVRLSPFSRSRNHGFRQAVPAAG